MLKKLARALDEFATCIDNNSDAIVNYGERYRCGERLSTGFVESAVNQVVAKRFVKKQQMRWTRAEPTCYFRSGLMFWTGGRFGQ